MTTEISVMYGSEKVNTHCVIAFQAMNILNPRIQQTRNVALVFVQCWSMTINFTGLISFSYIMISISLNQF